MKQIVITGSVESAMSGRELAAEVRRILADLAEDWDATIESVTVRECSEVTA